MSRRVSRAPPHPSSPGTAQRPLAHDGESPSRRSFALPGLRASHGQRALRNDRLGGHSGRDDSPRGPLPHPAKEHRATDHREPGHQQGHRSRAGRDLRRVAACRRWAVARRRAAGALGWQGSPAYREDSPGRDAVMPLEVLPLTSDGIEWDAFVRSTPGGSPFHLVAWKRAVESSFGHRPHYVMAVGEYGIEGVLPLFEVRGLLGGRGLISVPYGVYGGVCARSGPARQILLDHATELARRVGAAYVELRHRTGQEMDLPTKSLYVTFSRPISGDDDENLAAIPRKQRRMTRQGAKHGLRAEFGLQHLDAFYDIYARSVHQLGSPVFPRRLFTPSPRN